MKEKEVRNKLEILKMIEEFISEAQRAIMAQKPFIRLVGFNMPYPERITVLINYAIDLAMYDIKRSEKKKELSLEDKKKILKTAQDRLGIVEDFMFINYEQEGFDN